MHPVLKSTHTIAGAVEREARPVIDEARSIARQARSAIDTSADAARSSFDSAEIEDGVAVLARRVGRAADALRGADEVDGPTRQELADRERLRSALVAGVVLAVMSAIVFLVAREIARRRQVPSQAKDVTGKPETEGEGSRTRRADSDKHVAIDIERPASTAKPIAALNRQ